MPEGSRLTVAACWPSNWSIGVWSWAAALGSTAGVAGIAEIFGASGAGLPGLAFGSSLASGLGRDSSGDLSGVTIMSLLPRPPSLCSARPRASAQLCPRLRQEQEESTLLRYFRAAGESIYREPEID